MEESRRRKGETEQKGSAARVERHEKAIEEEAAKRGDLLNLPRMGQRFTDKLLKGIEDYRKNTSRFRIDVADLPYVKQLDLEYRYPAYTGMAPEVVEGGGDIAALRGTTVIVLIDDLDIRVLDRNTGTLIRKLVLDPTRDYQPRGVKCGNSPENRITV